jgi:aspartate-semialdehyde dehydrogenase
MKKKAVYDIAVVGATGAVGRVMLSILEERKFPIGKLVPLASSRSAGKQVEFNGRKITVEELKADSFAGLDIALFSAGGSVSLEFCPIAAQAGCVVIDNSSAFRMEKGIPLVVPEINPHAMGDNPGIIANPNCSTIQMVMVLKPIHDRYQIKRVVVSTYQSVSGTGQSAIEELKAQTGQVLKEQPATKEVYPHQIAFNCLPHIDTFLDSGYTKEEMKMVNETRKILEDDAIQVSPTTVRVPVFYAHSEAVNVETEQTIDLKELRKILSEAPGIRVIDAPQKTEYPLAVDAAGRDEVMVGRIRADLDNPRAVNLWIVADNLRKGAALNAIQIAEVLIRR